VLPAQEPPRPKPVTRCLEAGPFDSVQVSAVEAALAASPAVSALAGRWSRLSTETPGVWIIAVGRAAPHEAQLKKLAELKRLDIAVEVVKPAGGVEETLSIGQFDNLASAKAALEQFAARGVHTGRVVEISPASEVFQVRVDNATPPEATALEALPAGTAGKGFVNCEIP
jgi:L-alanine-DL-glutamate epimerase-like enolase superfamily enzyme